MPWQVLRDINYKLKLMKNEKVKCNPICESYVAVWLRS